MDQHNSTSPYSPPICVTDQRGEVWDGVPGFSNRELRNANQQPLSKRVSLIPVVGKRPPLHPEYAKNQYKYNFYMASYQGGCDYKESCDSAGDPIFIPHPNEPPESSQIRKRMSVVRNYCCSLVNKFGSYIFSQPIVRSAQPSFVEWYHDVDGLGTPLPQFMESVSDKARTLGMWGIIFDTTKENDDQTVSTATALGNRPILSHLHPNRILNWTPDKTQLLIQHDVGEFGELWLWDKLTISKFPLDSKGKVAAIGEVVVHGYPRMPVILCSGLNDYQSLIKDVAELQKRLFHLDSVLIEELIRQTFTSFLLIGVSDIELNKVAPFAISGRKFTCINKAANEVKVEPIGSNVSQADSLRNSIQDDEREIFRSMGLRVPDVLASHPESGKAIALREGETVNMAERIAANTESAERIVTELYNFATSSNIEAPRYPDAFNSEDLNQLLTNTILVMSNSFGPKLRSEMQIKFIRQSFREALPALRLELEQEAREQPEEQEEQEEQEEPASVNNNPATTPNDDAATADAAPAAPGSGVASEEPKVKVKVSEPK